MVRTTWEREGCMLVDLMTLDRSDWNDSVESFHILDAKFFMILFLCGNSERLHKCTLTSSFVSEASMEWQYDGKSGKDGTWVRFLFSERKKAVTTCNSRMQLAHRCHWSLRRMVAKVESGFALIDVSFLNQIYQSAFWKIQSISKCFLQDTNSL